MSSPYKCHVYALHADISAKTITIYWHHTVEKKRDEIVRTAGLYRGALYYGYKALDPQTCINGVLTKLK